MKSGWRRFAGGLALATVLGAGTAQAGDLIINTGLSDPAPRAAMKWAINEFKKENPGVHVTWNLYGLEGYKTAIRNFLQADPPDVLTWYAGNRMAPFVKAGAFMNVSALWKKDGLDAVFKSARPSMTIDGKQWGIPTSYYAWGIYYNKAVFKKFDVTPPKTWDAFLKDCAKFKAGGVTCTAEGNKALWPAAGWFDYLDLRTNGYKFHMALTQGKIAWTDPRVKKVFAEWARLIKPGYVSANSAALDWQDAVPQFVKGKAATYLMGSFAVDVFKSGGMKQSDIGFFPFPTINPDIPRAEEAPTDIVAAAARAPHPKEALKFLAFMASAKVQGHMNAMLGELPVNSKAPVSNDAFLTQQAHMLATASGLSQFFDRDAPAQMAEAGMKGFQEFMAHPDRIDAILARLDQVRKQVYRTR